MTTGTEIIDRTNRRTGDLNNQIFTRVEKLAEYNDLQTDISSRTACFKRQEDIQIQDGLRTYTFPEDMLELRQMTIEVVEGQLIFSSTYETLLNEGHPFHNVGTLGQQWHAPLSDQSNTITPSVGKVFFRDLVNNNEFMLDPIINTNNIQPRVKQNLLFGGALPELDPDEEQIQTGEIIELDRVPDAANQHDFWIDTGDTLKPRALWLAKNAYSITTATHTVLAATRPRSVDLVFSAVVPGSVGDFIDIVITNAGSTGTSTKTVTGTGTREDHYVYTFDLFENDSSNDSIIALLSGDPNLTATGADATQGSFTILTATSLQSGLINNWQEVTIRLIFTAKLPELLNESDTLHPSIPINIVQKIPEKLASVLLEMDAGGDRDLANILEARWEVAIGEAHRHRARATAPTDASPG